MQALQEWQQQHNDSECNDCPGNRTREKHRPVVVEADHGVHERILGNRPQDHTKHKRRYGKFQPLEAVADDAECDDQPQIRDIVADRKRADKAKNEQAASELRQLIAALKGTIIDEPSEEKGPVIVGGQPR